MRERQVQEQTNEAEDQGSSAEPDWLAGTGPEESGSRSDVAAAPEGPRSEAGQQGTEAGLTLEGQTNEQAAEQFAQQQAGEPDAPTKEQADRERDAVPFSIKVQGADSLDTATAPSAR